MRNPDGSPNTAHTTNLVHLIYVAEDAKNFRLESGILADIAPTLLFLLGLPKPAEMTGHNLFPIAAAGVRQRLPAGARPFELGAVSPARSQRCRLTKATTKRPQWRVRRFVSAAADWDRETRACARD